MKNNAHLRQLVDWKATIIAGFSGGLISFFLNMVLTKITLGSAQLFYKLEASLILGEKFLYTSETNMILVFFLGLVIHLILSIVFAIILTTIIHRWGLLVGIIGGAIFGLSLYIINFHLLSYYFPWFYPLKNWMFLVSHVIYGASVGGIYELLEVERYVISDRKEA